MVYVKGLMVGYKTDCMSYRDVIVYEEFFEGGYENGYYLYIDLSDGSLHKITSFEDMLKLSSEGILGIGYNPANEEVWIVKYSDIESRLAVMSGVDKGGCVLFEGTIYTLPCAYKNGFAEMNVSDEFNKLYAKYLLCG